MGSPITYHLRPMTLYFSDTICAIATPAGEGGIGIIRISGTDAEKIAGAVFRPAKKAVEFESHRLYYGKLCNPVDSTPLDSVLMAVMKQPVSFTGEDVVEFYCHGGQLVLQKVLELILRQGSRLAEPGEFAKRAFLNGKIDLTQAEAIIDLIRAKTDLSLKAAHTQLEGHLSKKVDRIKDSIIELLTYIEAELDFSDEEDVRGISNSEIENRLQSINGEIKALLSTYEEGRILREGMNCIILGRPNVGKSSLLNLLLKEERAIVTPVPGTTRDIIEEVINIKGIPLRLMDTAGLRDTEDEVESIGIRFTMRRLESSQMALLVVDISGDGFEEDCRILEKIGDKKKIIIGNKVDMSDEKMVSRFREAFAQSTKVEISALQKKGIEELRQTIYDEAIGKRHEAMDRHQEVIVSSVRHKRNLEEASQALVKAEEALKESLPMEFIAVELREAAERLGEITGVVTTEDILDRIFSQFCIGK